MSENQHLLNQLQQLLSWKKSKKFYAEKLGITEENVDELIKELRQIESLGEQAEVGNYIADLEEMIVKFEEDLQKGTGELIFNSKEEIKTLDDLIEKCKIDTDKWEITKYVQNYWGNVERPHWQVKAWLSKKKEEQLFQDSFINFLQNYKPVAENISSQKAKHPKPFGCLIINKQDSHLNKLDVDGDNDLDNRFENIIEKIDTILDQASLSNNLDEVYYIIGSDEFNSEFNGTTTKGTPQQNILSYHDAFQRICDHEITTISRLVKHAEVVNIVYVPGNHDEYVGWHLIKWLETYFRHCENIKFDASPKYRKYISFGKTAMMFNHGDAIKPQKLAALFPMEYKDEWSYHDFFYIFTGDKHHEVSHDFNGIKFYQIPAFSNAKSSWDDKNGYTTSKAEVTGFLIDRLNGMTNIFKQYL